MTYIERRRQIFNTLSDWNGENFSEMAIKIFRFQAEFNPVYAEYLKLINRTPENIQKISEIPFLPIQFFKNHPIRTGRWMEKFFFTSSGTTGENTSRHSVRDINFYLKTAEKGFVSQYGDSSRYVILGLIPNYLERVNSSLLSMVLHFIEVSKNKREPCCSIILKIEIGNQRFTKT